MMTSKHILLLLGTVNGFLLSSLRPRSQWTSFRMSQSLEGITASTVPDMEAYATGYRTVFNELPCKDCAPSVGSLPEDLVGTYFRCGPAMFSAGSIVPPRTSIVQPKSPPLPDGQDPTRMVKHPFEGDGGILAVTFNGNGNAISRFRYVRTAAFTNERRKGQRLYTAMDSTRDLGPSAGAGLGNDMPLPLFRHHLQPGLNRNRKNTSNTRAVYWAKRLLTLWEGGLPYKLDALALSTEGRSQLGGVLKEQNPFGAKAVYDPTKDRMLFYANKQDPKKSELTVFEFNSKFRLVKDEGGTVVTELPGFAILSDFAATKNYSIFVQPPVSANGMKFMFAKEPGTILQVENSPSYLHLIPRVGSGKSPLLLTIPFDGTVEGDLQFCNAFEEDGKVVLDAIRSDGKSVQGSKVISYPWASSMDDYAQSTSKKSLWRYTVDLKTRSVAKDMLSEAQCYFGTVNPAFSTQKHRFLYFAVGSMGNKVTPPQGIAKMDCESQEMVVWMPNAYEFCGEPMYAPRKNGSSAEDDGYILSVLYNGKNQESELVVLRANAIAAGPVARVSLGIAVPHGLHGCFTNAEEATWSAEEIERRSKLADKMESRGNMWNEVKSDFSGLGLRLDDFEEYFGDIL